MTTDPRPTLAQVLAFLLGEGELNGHSFGGQRPRPYSDGVFWWRPILRAAIEADRAAAPTSCPDCAIYRRLAAECGSCGRLLPGAAPTARADAVVYPPDGTVSPFTVINLGAGAVQMGDSVHDQRLPALWFGKNGQGMGHEEEMNRQAHEGETIAVVTFANVEGLDVLLEVINRIRRQSFPAAPTPEAAPTDLQAQVDALTRERDEIAVKRQREADRCDGFVGRIQELKAELADLKAAQPAPPEPVAQRAEPVGEIVGTEKRGFALMTVVNWEPGFNRMNIGTKLYATPPLAPQADSERLTDVDRRLDAILAPLEPESQERVIRAALFKLAAARKEQPR